MEKKGIVSLWLGNFQNIQELEEFVNLSYDDDGESVPSRFFLEFNIDIDDIEEDFIEKAVLENTSNDIAALLKGCSYEEVIIPRILDKCNIKLTYNTIILIYDFEYNGSIQVSNDTEFITTVNYL
ncbi:immunity 22 family protein [Listeria seeligeri]|uniref:immunity 22 family protein n=1 Tax=Listeria seeligeri TaxID=1640 RepID=UPI001623C4DD|nr:immunity 22 family protein [Listeria seeligeri]MBC1425615.1 immunity 22 family protein [Listeria seeligeri]MBC1777189.1 immunity 22 family protein [Listeria seeligeri]MBC1828327.1 immunity 22 family protein [Listeria seeligeri]MBC6121691.1 immunity 22 family protein [Listeria seeligeri]MBC6144622.1 immunity 22 family protein [Listeria seeligeri]